MRILEELNHDESLKYYFETEYENERSTQIVEKIKYYINLDNKLEAANIYSSFCNAICVLTRKNARNIIRNPGALRLQFGQIFFFSFLAGSIFWKLPNTSEGNRGRLGFAIFFTHNNFIIHVMRMVVNFPLERLLLKDDYNSNLYGIGSFTFAKQIVETPIALLLSTIFVCVVYFMVGYQETAVNFFTFLGIYVTLAFYTQSFGYAFTSLFSSMDQAFRTINISVVVFIIFSGVIINHANMPVWLGWIRFIDPIFYGFQCAIVNEFTEYKINEGFDFFALLNKNIPIWKYMVILIGISFFLRILQMIELQMVVNRKL